MNKSGDAAGENLLEIHAFRFALAEHASSG
jgi:hypothetical protein